MCEHENVLHEVSEILQEREVISGDCIRKITENEENIAVDEQIKYCKQLPEEKQVCFF